MSKLFWVVNYWQDSSGRKYTRILGLLLVVLCLCAFGTVLSNQFVSFDDYHYISENNYVRQGITPDNLKWAFDFNDKTGFYWQPLTWISLMFDFQLFGLNPSWFHFVNLLLHTLSSLLLFKVLTGMTGNNFRSFLVAAIFAIHPLQVESIAWAAERKTALCGLFFMLSLIAYSYYVRKPSVCRYFLLCLMFASGLMAKTMIVQLPFILLFLDIWPLCRINQPAGNSLCGCRLPSVPFRYAITEKIPLLFMSLASVAVSIFSLSQTSVIDERNLLPLSNKLANALVSLWTYIGMLFWPVDLAVFYPVKLIIPEWQVLVSGFLMLVVTIIAILRFERLPWLMVGWGWYLVSMLPVSGLIRRGLWPAMADRFIYIPIIGLSIVIVWWWAELLDRYSVNRLFVSIGVLVVIVLLMVLCQRRVAVWFDTGTLFQDAVNVTENNDIALANLGWHRFGEGNYGEAFRLFEEVSKIDSSKPDFEYSKGAFQYNNQQYRVAAGWFEKALERDPKHLASLFFLGMSYEKSHELLKSATIYNRLVHTDGIDPKQYRNKAAYRLKVEVQPLMRPILARLEGQYRSSGNRMMFADVLRDSGFHETALREYSSLPGSTADPDIRCRMACAFGQMGDRLNAEIMFLDILGKNPAHCGAATGLGNLYMSGGQWGKALSVYEKAVQKGGDCPQVEFDSALCLFFLGGWGESLERFQAVGNKYPQLKPQASRYVKRLNNFN